MSPERAAMLLAFKTDEVSLTRREIMTSAEVDDRHQFQYLLDAKLLQQTAWHPDEPRTYKLTPLGMDRRELYNVSENLHYG